jgi:hypothetical protein
LFLSFSSATDTIGVRLFKDDFRDVWTEQQKHVACIQDPPEMQLYTITNHLQKGGIRLPVYRCARGSTSLESFHLHLARFIPGTSANAVNIQAYLMDGITRWNASRAAAALDTPKDALRTFDLRLQSKVNKLHDSMFGTVVIPDFVPPAKFTDELFGVEYLFHQTGTSFTWNEEIDQQIDEGFVDQLDEELDSDRTVSPTETDSEKFEVPIPLPDDSESSSGDEEVSCLDI